MKAVVSIVAIITFLVIAQEVRSDERHCLAEAMYHEARGQGLMGMLAVGVVIQNRVKHKNYPDTVCGVVRQGPQWKGNPVRDRCQFSYWCDGRPEKVTDMESWGQALSVATTLLTTRVDFAGLEGATHYHADRIKPVWASGMRQRLHYKQHVFYSEK